MTEESAARSSPDLLDGSALPGAAACGQRSRWDPKLRHTEHDPQQKLPFTPVADDAPLCSQRGSIMSRNGACYQCENCGRTSGCS